MRASVPESVRTFGRRRWRARLSAGRRWLLAGGVVLVAGFVAWVVCFSSWLATTSIEVQGAGVDPQLVRSAADIAPGTPLARVDLSAVASRVRRIPAVASAQVSRQWPHTIVIRVTRRVPVGAIESAGHWWSMDDTGALFDQASAPLAGVPVVRLDGVPAASTRDEVAAVLASLPGSLEQTTRTVTASSVDSITLELKNGSAVRWGTADQSVAKARVLDALLLHHHATLYDVSIPSQPAIRG